MRAELNAESSGDVKGVKAARVVAEMRDIKTDVDPAMFQPPAGYDQVPPEKVRQQIDALTGAVTTILKGNDGRSLRHPPPPRRGFDKSITMKKSILLLFGGLLVGGLATVYFFGSPRTRGLPGTPLKPPDTSADTSERSPSRWMKSFSTRCWARFSPSSGRRN